MCKFGNKNVFLTLWHFWWNIFDFLIFSIYRKWEFSIFLKIVSATFFRLITTLSDCANSKKVGLKFVSKNVN